MAGNGQSQLIETIAGIRTAVSGRVLLDGQVIDITGAADPGELRDRGSRMCRKTAIIWGWFWPSRNTKIQSSATMTIRFI